MTRIVVTGATGFIGRHLLAQAVERGIGCATPSRGRLADSDLVHAMGGCAAVVHLAGRAHVLREVTSAPDEEFRAANVVLTRRVATAARRAGIRRFVYVSSAGVLGQVSPPDGFDDASPPAPYDAYTRSKLEAERLLADEFAGSLEICIVRPPLVYGPGAPGNFGRLMRAVLAGWPVPLGAIDSRRSLIGARNLVDLLLRAATRPGGVEAAMLVADAEAVAIRDFVGAVAAAAGRPGRLINVPTSLLRAALGAVGRGADAARLTQPFVVRPVEVYRRLGWSPPHSMQEELAWTMATMLADGGRA